MAQIAFDTLEYSNILQSGGIPREQADAIARANANALANMMTAHDLATKKDLAIVKAELEAKIEETRSALEAKITETRNGLDAKIIETRGALEGKLAETKHDLLKWIIGLAMAQIALMGAIAGIVISVLK